MASRIPFALIGPRALPAGATVVFFVVLITVLLLSSVSCVREEDLSLEQRAHQLAGELMCPVCDGQTIDGSSAQISQDMRAKVRERLDAGDTNAEIKDYFVVRYGSEILAAPERSGFNLLAWIVPVVIVIGGFGIALITIKNMRKSATQMPPTSAELASASESEDDLTDYLAQVDRDLGIAPKTKTQSKPNASDEAKS
tara:strand:+ start:5185 stop:5778 length:594 start_codon:yes stop_codon:yes gene_type:complete